MVNIRKQVGYITVSLFAQCVLDDGVDVHDLLVDSLSTLINPQYVGSTPYRDLLFQRSQEHDVLYRVLRKHNKTVEQILGEYMAGVCEPFWSDVAKQAIVDARTRESINLRFADPKELTSGRA